MKKELNEFVEEITTNFSELFVETFFLRFLGEFKKGDLIKTLKITNTLLEEKIQEKINDKLNNMGYNDIEFK